MDCYDVARPLRLAQDQYVNTAAVQWPLDYTVAVMVAVILIGVLAYDGWVGRP